MKKSFLFLFLSIAALTTSCSDDDDKGSVSSKSRDIKYEITGNFSGDLDITYITASGGATNAEATSLPWEMSFTADSDSHGATFNASGIGGNPGEKIRLNIYQGGKVSKYIDATADSDGDIVAVAPTVTF